MTNRNRTNPVQFYLSDDEQYILQHQIQSIRHEEYVCVPAQADLIWICV
ncbi:hypothetical protein RTO_28090 [[Ruminococcus] torques L2-14]|uniref:Uncharacterized protein n=1 Tax=[Ruminococcus] torques L2-14 TaxID=657313 RepID=D4LZP2_9FIRM|nr:hypothetical protein RTO_28090 [[Ruminococcus] torques L2-14]